MKQFLVIHRWCPSAVQQTLQPIGVSRDGRIGHLARPETVTAFNEMKNVADSQGVKLHIIWAYRDPLLQREQYREAQRKYGKRQGIRWLAPPGFSEHQTGWVLDIGDEDDPEADDNPLFERTLASRWLQKNAARFCFELSFKPGNWQGISYEPWHWRYVGTAEAYNAFHPSGIRALAIWGVSLGHSLRRLVWP